MSSADNYANAILNLIKLNQFTGVFKFITPDKLSY